MRVVARQAHPMPYMWAGGWLSCLSMICARGPSSLWCGTCAGGLSQQLTALAGRISMFNTLVNASTNNETFGAKSFWRVQVYASSQSWTTHPCPSMSSSRNCPMFKMVRAGRQIKGLEVSTIQCHVASILHAWVYMAASLPSIRGWTSSHHSTSSFSIFSSHSSSQCLVLHRGSTFLANEEDISWWEGMAADCQVPPYFTLSK